VAGRPSTGRNSSEDAWAAAAAELLTRVSSLDLSALTLALLVLAAFAAGWVDAVVGGGGLLQLPALLIGLPPDTPPACAGDEQGVLDLRHRHQLGDLRAEDQA